MTAEQFITEAQGYFGPYNATQKKYVRQWLAPKSERTIAMLFAETLKSVSPIYKTPPGIKELEDAEREAWRRRGPELQAPPMMQIEYMPTDEERKEAAELLRGLLDKLKEKHAEYSAERGEDVKKL